MEGRRTIEIGGRDRYPSSDELYSAFPHDVDVVPSSPRIEVGKPSLAVYAEAFNEFVDEPGMEGMIEDYVRQVWEPQYREIEPVWEFLRDVPQGVENEEELLSLAEGYGDGVAENLHLLLQEASWEAHTVDDLQEFFRHELERNHFWHGVVHHMEHEEGFDLERLLKNLIMEQVNEEYQWTGTLTRDVYRDGDDVYAMVDGEERMEKFPDERAALPLDEMVETYELMVDGEEDMEDIRQFFNDMRELYRLGSVQDRDAEVFYDSREDTLYVYDHEAVDFHPADEVAHWLDNVSIDFDNLGTRGVDDSQDSLFDKFMSPEERGRGPA